MGTVPGAETGDVTKEAVTASARGSGPRAHLHGTAPEAVDLPATTGDVPVAMPLRPQTHQRQSNAAGAKHACRQQRNAK